MQAISNRQLTLLRKMNRKKHRRREGRFLVEGERAVEQVLNNGVVTVEHLFFDREQRLWETGAWEQTVNAHPAAAVESGDFRDVTDTDNPQGVVALCAIPAETPLERLSASEGLVVAADRIRDPGNLGTILRTAAWFGAVGLLAGKGTVDLFHPKVVRSTAGATGTVPFRNADLTEELDRLEQNGWRILLLDAGPGSVSLRDVPAGGKTAVVVGNEAHGIDRRLFGNRRTGVRIDPGRFGGTANIESLNASISLSIALYALST